MVVADTRLKVILELMLPFNGWFCIAYPQIPYIVVYQLVMIALIPFPADQFALFQVSYVSPINLSINCGTPLLVGFQVNQPYFMNISVPYQSLFRTDHIDSNKPKIFAFHFLPKQGFSVAVSVEKKNPSALLII